MEDNIQQGDYIEYETMLQKSVLLVSARQKPIYTMTGINIFILVASNNHRCTDSNEDFVTSTSLKVTINNYDDMPIMSITLVCGLYLFACMIGGVALVFGPKHKIEFVGRFNMVSEEHIAKAESQNYQIAEVTRELIKIRRSTRRRKSVNDNDEIIVVQVKHDDDEKVVKASFVTLADYLSSSKKDMNHIKTKSRQYVWLIMTVGIYYTLPVIQLVLLYQSMSAYDGNQDLCYYNYECQYPMAGIQDFGNFFSNIGYVVLGMCFTAIVSFRWFKYRRFKEKLNYLHVEKNIGIPEQFGIFSSLGIALVLEGMLSASYHICPTKENFQFDTTFMYFIAVLLFLKVFQFRHPNLIHTSHRLFLLIGVALIEETLGYYINSFIFTLLFIIIYVIVLVVILYGIYWDGETPGIVEAYTQIITAFLSAVQNPKEVRTFPWSFITVMFINISMAIYIGIAQEPSRTSLYLLFIFMVNMAMYLGYYTFMKVYLSLYKKEANETVRLISWFYFVAAFATALPSLYYFQIVQRDSSKSPAESRNLNQPCTLGIYDAHDFWHFLSASGLFFMFLFILTLEDHNLTVNRKSIQVF